MKTSTLYVKVGLLLVASMTAAAICCLPLAIDAAVLFYVWNLVIAPLCPLLIGQTTWVHAIIAACCLAWFRHRSRSCNTANPKA